MSSSNAPSTSVLDAMSPNPEALNLDPQVAYGEAEFETVADRLMEQLFADVERMLERGGDLSEPPQPRKQPDPDAIAQLSFDLQSPASVPADSSSLILAPKLTPRPSLLAQAESEEELAALTELMAELQESPTPEKLTKTLNKVLLGLIVTAIAAGGAAWYFRDRLPMLTAFIKSATAPAPVAVAPPSPVDLQQKQNEDFLAYVGRSLDRIERDTKQQRSRAAIASAAPSPAVTPGLAPGLERIYIPVPQSPPIASSNAPVIVTQPFAQPAFPQATFPQTAPLQPAAPPSATAPATTPNIAAASSHVLIGILELGDRSAALIETNGTPQRVQIGEAVGSSGWTLVSVKNQEAIVRRNGEVRSIYVGQQF